MFAVCKIEDRDRERKKDIYAAWHMINNFNKLITPGFVLAATQAKEIST